MFTHRRRPLPSQPLDRTLELVRRSAASPLAPPTGLPPDLDILVRERERDRSVLYARMDDVLDRCARLASQIDASGIVVDIIDPDDEDSLVQSVDGLTADLAAGLTH